jgi:hypothetical protein
LARDLTNNPNRRLIYAAPLDSYIAEKDCLNSPIFLDHFGNWHALVDLHPSAVSTKSPVRITPVVQAPLIC